MPTIRSTVAAASRDVTALRAVCDGCDAPRPHEEHAGEPSVWLVTAGAFALRDRRGMHVLDPTCALVLAPDEPFTIRHPAGPDTCISLRGPLATQLAAAGPRVLRLDAPTHAAIVAAVAACRRGDADAFAIADTLAAIDSDVPAPTCVSRAQRELAAALAHELQLSFAEPASLDELAAAAGASVFHACRVFRRATGMTLHGYRRRLRIRHALALLVDSDAPLADVAARTGFASQSHLTNLFRAELGTTPGRVRARRALT